MRRSLLRSAFMTLLVLGGLLAATSVVHAQNRSFVVPKANTTKLGNFKSDIPFARGLSRYQQVIKAAALKTAIKSPVRLTGMQFRAASNNQAGTSLDIAISVGLLKSAASSTFASNLKNAVNVWPRSKVTLRASTSLAWVLNFPFSKEVTWDGKSDVIIDIQVFGNGLKNKAFFYDFDTVLGNYPMDMLMANSPTSTRASFRTGGRGLVVRFDYKGGVAFRYGKGCSGSGNFIPRASVNTAPSLGAFNFSFQLTQALGNSPALVRCGFSDTKWGATKLPFDLTKLGVWGCTLYAEPAQIWGTVTSGKGAGAGQAVLGLPIPPINALIGTHFYFQWTVLDQGTKRPIPLSFSDAFDCVIG